MSEVVDIKWTKVDRPPDPKSRPGFVLMSMARAFPTPAQGIQTLVRQLGAPVGSVMYCEELPGAICPYAVYGWYPDNAEGG